MTTSIERLRQLETLLGTEREGQIVEFKMNLDDPDEIGEYLSALANSAALERVPMAWMAWGIEDGSKTVKGTRFDPFTQKSGPKSNQSLIMWLQSMTEPRADFDFHEISHPNGRVILLEIHAARSAPVAFRSVRYVRLDSHKTKLGTHPDREGRLWSLLLGADDDWSGEIVPDANLHDLDPTAIEVARDRFLEHLLRIERDEARKQEIHKEVDDLDVATLLNKARITKGGRVTNTALLLLGKDESSHLLTGVDAKISWILRHANGDTKSSIPFGVPYLLATERAYRQIENDMVERMPDGTLFPEAVQRYDPWVMREALHNCVAHQDYRLGGKINLVEYPDRLVLSNLGQFIPESVEWMLEHQSPPERYRNKWLIDGMIRLRMIEQVGSGIRKMFTTQRQRLFPLPDYRFEPSAQGDPRVELTLQGNILDLKFTRALAARDDLSLGQVLLLDRVQKRQALQPDQVRTLKRLNLVEGRVGNLRIAASIAATAGQKGRYINDRGMKDHWYRQLVLEFLEKYGAGRRSDFDDLLLPKLPDVMDQAQKNNKVKNLLQTMRRNGLVHTIGPRSSTVWHSGPDPGHENHG